VYVQLDDGPPPPAPPIEAKVPVQIHTVSIGDNVSEMLKWRALLMAIELQAGDDLPGQNKLDSWARAFLLQVRYAAAQHASRKLIQESITPVQPIAGPASLASLSYASLTSSASALHLPSRASMNSEQELIGCNVPANWQSMAWALHASTSSQAALVERLPGIPSQADFLKLSQTRGIDSASSGASGDFSWSALRALGVGYWLTSPASLEALIDRLARAIYRKTKSPRDCMLFYLLIG
jgi:hypothetical protein